MLSNAKCATMIPAKDFERAKKFYRDTLGLKLSDDQPSAASFECANGTMFSVYPSQLAGTNQATAMGWAVVDLEAEVTDLKGRGIKFEEYDMGEIKTVDGIATIEGEKAAWFKDSEGNILSLWQKA